MLKDPPKGPPPKNDIPEVGEGGRGRGSGMDIPGRFGMVLGVALSACRNGDGEGGRGRGRGRGSGKGVGDSDPKGCFGFFYYFHYLKINEIVSQILRNPKSNTFLFNSRIMK